MSRIEQAVFTSARTDRGVGYHVVAASPGVTNPDRRELTIWGPSHDSLLHPGRDAVSFNFFPLPSGAFCVSRTASVGWEYSARGGARVYTQCLLAPRDVLLRFANRPLALARAAVAAGVLNVPAEDPTALDWLDLPGGAPAVDPASLARLLEQVGAWRVAMLVQAVLQSAGVVAASGSASAEQLIAGVLDCLPVECRAAISFSTGLKFSSRRPFRVVPLPDDAAIRRRLARQHRVTVLDLNGQEPRDGVITDDWARFIEHALSNSQMAFLTDALSQPRPTLTLNNLSALGRQLLEAAALRGNPPTP